MKSPSLLAKEQELSAKQEQIRKDKLDATPLNELAPEQWLEKLLSNYTLAICLASFFILTLAFTIYRSLRESWRY